MGIGSTYWPHRLRKWRAKRGDEGGYTHPVSGAGPARAADEPSISVIIPVHDREDLIGTCVASVKNQRVDGAVVEIIVVDDHSDDASAQVALDSGATVITLPENLGPGAARNRGIAVARGEWIALLDSDDLWHPEHLQTLWDHREGVALVCASALRLGEDAYRRVHGNPWLGTIELRSPDDILRPENVINTSGVMLRADVLRDTGGFSPSRYSEDLELWIRILTKERGRVLPQLTVVNREHSGRVTRTHRGAMSQGTYEVIATATAAHQISERTLKRVEAAANWDGWRSDDSRRLRDLRQFVHLGDTGKLLDLWWQRAKLRHRWRLSRSRSAELVKLMESAHNQITNPSVGL